MDRYSKSVAMLQRAERVIPLGSQTFSKSKTQFAVGTSPLFISHGKGAHVWDVDGNEYIDYINALLPVVLGYDDVDVMNAVKAQLDKGVIFSLASEIEVELAEKLVEIIPCAEKVRYGKNGSDVTSAAIRIARAYTGRDRIAVCGYHGWQDWYIGSTTRNKGVPKAVSELTSTFQYNNIDSLHALFIKHPGQYAAVIMEPANVVAPATGFLESVKELAHAQGALFILDEIVTGFRYALGGAQSYFNVVPDLATFGKTMANGFPLSAIVGKAEYMREIEDIFFSFTFGGETLSLAACLATVRKMEKDRVIESLWEKGEILKTQINQLSERHELGDVVAIRGYPCIPYIIFQDTNDYSQWDIKSFAMQELYLRNILTIGSLNLSYAHTDDDLRKTITVFDEVFGLLSQVLRGKNLIESLNGAPLRPLFSVR